MQPPIQSRTVPSSSILLKVTVPRRRRKNVQTEEGVEPKRREQTLLGKLRASKGKYKVETVGMIERTVRFRGFFFTSFGWVLWADEDIDMANYQFNTSRSPFVGKIKETVLDCQCASLFLLPLLLLFSVTRSY